MSPSEAAWHLVNFFAPALGMGLLAAGLAKLLWRDTFRGISGRRLAFAAVAGCTLALIAGLWLFGRDGRMATYAAMTLACASALALTRRRQRQP